MENKNKIELPELCYVATPSTGEIVIVKRYISGYYPLDYKETRNINELNEAIGVSKAQSQAMLVGSMFGWNVEGANPNNYNEDGSWKKEDLKLTLNRL